MTVFEHIRKLASLRCTRIVAVFMLVMCTVTWVGQSVSAVQDGELSVALAAADEVPEQPTLADPDCVDAFEAECEVIPLVALDETHDVKLFFLREFTHWFQPAVSRLPRNRDHAAILRMVSETFRPPDPRSGRTGRIATS